MLLVYIFLLSASGNLLVYGKSTYGPWGDWSDCSVDEGRGVMTRSRECVVDECPQPGEYVDAMACFVKPCDCKFPIPGTKESATAGSEEATAAEEFTTSGPEESTTAEEFTTSGPKGFTTTPLKKSTSSEEETTGPSTSEEETTSPFTPEEETTVPSTPEEETTTPSTPEEETTGPSTPEEETTGPSTPEKETTGPFTPEEKTTGQSTPEEETTGSSTPVEETTAPSTPEEETTAPSTPEEETTAPSTPEEETTAPSTPEEETTSPSTSEEETTAPSTSEEETTSPSTSEEETTGPITSEEETTAPTTSGTLAAVTEPTEPAMGSLLHSTTPAPTEIACEDNPLGAEDGGKLPSSSFKSSTSFDTFPPSSGRLHGTMAWCAADSTAGDEFLQIHIPEAKIICAIATQGSGFSLGTEHVTAYMLKFSDDGIGWQTLEEDGNVKVFDGNKDSKSVSKRVLPVPIEATYIRIYPLDFEGWICMRAEVYGKEVLPKPPIQAEEETTGPSTSEEETTSPFTSEEETTGSSTTEEETTGPSTPEEETTGPSTTEEETTSPSTPEEETTAPSTSEEETTSPSTSVLQCEPVGAAYGESLPDSSFTASTEAGQDYAAYEGRLNGPSAWCPDNPNSAYLQIKLPSEMEICGVETQGISSFGALVTKYEVTIGDGAEWKLVQKIFDGNTDADEPSFQSLPDPMTGQYIRIYPLEGEVSPCLRVEIYAKATTTTAPHPTEQKNTSEQEPTYAEPISAEQTITSGPTTAESTATGAISPVPTTPSKGIDVGILVDNSFGVTSDEFEKLKLFISQLVDSITDHYGLSVQFGFIVYSDEPDLVMTLKMFSDVDVSGIIRGIKYIPGEGHRTDLAMLKATRELFCSEGCGLRSEGENVLIVFTSENNDAGSFPYSFISPKMKDASLNIIAVGIKPNVGQSELTKIALGSSEHVIKVPSPNDLDSSVVDAIEEMISQGQAEPNASGPAEQEADSPRRVNFRNAWRNRRFRFNDLM